MVLLQQLAMIQLILPKETCAIETSADAGLETLWPQEFEFIKSAVASRQGEYSAVRMCAREAMAHLGIPAGPVLNDDKRCPIWPEGIIGSMTHCRGYRAAALAREGILRSLGIDAEPAEPLPRGVFTRIATPIEAEVVLALTGESPDIPWDRLLFSLKESLYKAWYPLTRTWLGYRDTNLCLRLDGTAEITVNKAMPAQVARPRWYAAWRVVDTLILTAVWAM